AGATKLDGLFASLGMTMQVETCRSKHSRKHYGRQEGGCTRLWADGVRYCTGLRYGWIGCHGARSGTEVSGQGLCRNREILGKVRGATSGEGRDHGAAEGRDRREAERHDQTGGPGR